MEISSKSGSQKAPKIPLDLTLLIPFTIQLVLTLKGTCVPVQVTGRVEAIVMARLCIIEWVLTTISYILSMCFSHSNLVCTITLNRYSYIATFFTRGIHNSNSDTGLSTI